MFALRRRLRLATWIVLIAVWGLVVAPTMSQAMNLAHARSTIDPWIEICSAGDGSGSASHGSSEHIVVGHLGHCALCGQHATPPALPVAVAAPLAVVDGAHYVPRLFHHAPRPLFAWTAIHARAPPPFLS